MNQPEHRRYLFAIACRMLGTVAKAEDAVQEAYVRLERQPPGSVDAPRSSACRISRRGW